MDCDLGRQKIYLVIAQVLLRRLDKKEGLIVKRWYFICQNRDNLSPNLPQSEMKLLPMMTFCINCRL